MANENKTNNLGILQNNSFNISSHYSITRQADLMSKVSRGNRTVSIIGPMKAAYTFSGCVPSKRARHHILSKKIPMIAIHKLSNKIYDCLIKGLKKEYPKLKPNEYIMVDGYRDQIIPLPKQHDFEMYVTGTVLRVISNPKEDQK